MANVKVIASVFVLLTVIFAASASYLYLYPPAAKTVTSTVTSSTATTFTSLAVQTVTSSATQTVTYSMVQTVVSSAVQTVTYSTVQTFTSPTVQTVTFSPPPLTVTSTSLSTITQTSTLALSVNVEFNPSIGAYLTNGTGWTLYLFAKDIPNNGTSACNGGCAQTWHPFYSNSLNLPPGLTASSFGVITRTDGSMQSTYNGWPLYTYASDKQPGQINGEGVAGFWYAASPGTQPATQLAGSTAFTVGIAYKSPIGVYLTNSSGWTLYVFGKDIPNNGTSACNGGCAQTWHPFYVSTLRAPPGLSASLFGVITRTDGTKQSTYDGYPLYYYASDKQPGQTNGEGIGGVWFACALPKPVFTTTSTSTTTTSSAASTTTSTRTSTTTTQSSTSSSSSSSSTTNSYVITIPAGTGSDTGLNFEPSTLTVAPGTTIVFMNNDTTSIHNIYFTTIPSGASVPANPSPNSNMWSNNMFSVVLTVPGTYTFVCQYHSWMMGTITVT